MLDRLRSHFPHTQSMLMDRITLLNHERQWVPEPKQSVAHLPYLSQRRGGKNSPPTQPARQQTRPGYTTSRNCPAVTMAASSPGARRTASSDAVHELRPVSNAPMNE